MLTQFELIINQSHRIEFRQNSGIWSEHEHKLFGTRWSTITTNNVSKNRVKFHLQQHFAQTSNLDKHTIEIRVNSLIS